MGGGPGGGAVQGAVHLQPLWDLHWLVEVTLTPTPKKKKKKKKTKQKEYIDLSLIDEVMKLIIERGIVHNEPK